MKYQLSLPTMLGFLFVVSTVATTHAATVSCTSASTNNWIPSRGYAIIGQDNINASNSHYIKQYVYWRTASRLVWFAATPDSTYEPDALFYNYDNNGTYGFAPLGYWSSDLPSPYIDTQAFDSNNEKAITVGSANARFIQPGKFYSTMTRMTWESGPNATNTRVKLSSQRGRRVPSGCYSTFCSFGCSTSNNYRTVTFQDGFRAPGAREWWWLDPISINRPW